MSSEPEAMASLMAGPLFMLVISTFSPAFLKMPRSWAVATPHAIRIEGRGSDAELGQSLGARPARGSEGQR